MEKKIERRLRCFNCGRWNVWDKPLHPDCLCGDAQYTSKALSNQPIEEKWKIQKESIEWKEAEDDIIDKVQDCIYGFNLNVTGEKYTEILGQIKNSIWLRGEIQRVFETILEQERKKLVKQIDSFPLSDSMFFDENNWKAGYKALEEFKKAIINK